MAKVFLNLMLWDGIRSADFWQQIVIVTLSQLSAVRWHPQEERFLLIVSSCVCCYLPSLFEPVLLLKTMVLLLLLFTITALSGIHFI